MSKPSSHRHLIPIPNFAARWRSSGRAVSIVAALGSLVLIAVWLRWVAATRFSEPPVRQVVAELVGFNNRLFFRDAGPDLTLGTADDRQSMRQFYVPADAEVRLRLRSLDLVYLIEIPDHDVYEFAAPDLEYEIRFHTALPGKHPLLGNQMCGDDHPELIGSLVVLPSTQYVHTRNQLPHPPQSKGDGL